MDIFALKQRSDYLNTNSNKRMSSLAKLVDYFGLDNAYRERIIRDLVYILKPPQSLSNQSLEDFFFKYNGDDPDLKDLQMKNKSLKFLRFNLSIGRYNSQLKRKLSMYLNRDLAERIDRYVEDPLAVIYHLFLNEPENIKIELNNEDFIESSRNALITAELYFYYKSELITKFQVINKGGGGLADSLSAYLVAREWNELHSDGLAQILVPIEFPFRGLFSLNTVRRFYEFDTMGVSQKSEDKMDDGWQFLRKRKVLPPSSTMIESHINSSMEPPAMILIDFEFDQTGGGA